MPTHVVGPPITIDDRTIQRCLICGLKMKDSSTMPANIYEMAGIRPYENGALVFEDEEGQLRVVMRKELRRGPDEREVEFTLPDDICINLVEL